MARLQVGSFFVVCAGLCSLSGCRDEKPGSLEGYWEGSIACGDAGGVGIEYNVEKGDESDEYDAEGLITALSISSEPSDVEITAVWTQPKASGPQVIEMDSTCVLVQVNGVSDMPCESFDELGWDGANVLEATISNFLESGLDCDLTLVR